MPLLTYTDRVLLTSANAAPSLTDIAVSTSRMPRFGGHTRRWWSVLDHLLLCDEIARHEYRGDHQLPQIRLAALLHDAHEAITGDIPTDAKSPDMRELQQRLDEWIMRRYFPGGPAAYSSFDVEVKHIDRIALVVEANLVGPPVSRERLVEVEPRFAMLGAYIHAHALLRTRLEAMNLYGLPPLVSRQEDHPAVREYLNRLSVLL